MATQKCQISSLTAQNKKIILDLIASGIDIPDSDPSLGEEDSKDCKMVANKKNSNLAKTNKRRKWQAGRPQGNISYMSCDQIAVAMVQTVKSSLNR